MSFANVSESSSQTPSPIITKTRSESSPAKISTPVKISSPVMKSPGPVMPPLKLDRLGTDEARLKGYSEPVLKSPKSASGTISQVRFSSATSTTISTSAPSTPRKSPRPVGEYRSSSIRNSVKSPAKNWDPDINPIPSPRKVDRALIGLCDEVAKLCFDNMKSGASSTKSPRDSDLKSLFRQDIRIPLDQMSAALRARLPQDFKSDTILHSELISALFDPAFLKSPVGKALLGTRKTVMDDYNDPSHTISNVEARSETEPGWKEQMQQNIVDRAEAFALTAFGQGARRSAADNLSTELAALWKALDQKLCKINPDRGARERLAYDLIITRNVMSKSLGKNKDEAGLVLPIIFVAAIKSACEKPFADFVARFIDAADVKQSTPSSTKSSGGSVSTLDQG